QRNRGAEVLRGRQSCRQTVRQSHREPHAEGSRRRRTRRQVQQPSRCGAADDVSPDRPAQLARHGCGSSNGIRSGLADRRGARSADVLSLVMRESMTMVAVGVAIGLAGAFGASRFVATLLFGLAPTDPLTMFVAVSVMIVVSAFAGYLPARRAARVDPMVAL